MRINTSGLRISNSEMPPQLTAILETLRATTSNEELAVEMFKIKEWHTLFGKTEMNRWAEILNRCDDILREGCTVVHHRLAVDTDPAIRQRVLAAIHFSALIFENTSSRSSYASVDNLLLLMDCSQMSVLISILHFLQLMSKRSRFLSSRLDSAIRIKLSDKLVAISECWGGRLRQMKLEDCLNPSLEYFPLFPLSFTTAAGNYIEIPHPGEDVPPLEVLEQYGKNMDLSDADRASLLARVRLLCHFGEYSQRVDSMIARLIAISTLMYSRVDYRGGEDAMPSLPPQFIEETCAILKEESFGGQCAQQIDNVKAEALRCLTAIISNDAKMQRFATIVEELGATSYHGFLASFTRKCVEDLKSEKIGSKGHASVSLCTALFSLLYHMSSYEQPRGANSPGSLITAGITQTMLSVIGYHNMPLDLIAFATRCVRVIDIVTSLDFYGFITHKGMEICINRLVHEVNECKKEQSYLLDFSGDVEGQAPPARVKAPPTTVFCHHQRAALIKSLLNFIKRIINEREFVEQVRHLMDGELPSALLHIFSNIDYYSPSLFHNSMMVVQNFVYQEPAQLTLLQQKHVPYAVLVAILRKEIPPSREIISMMTGVFNALCLNERGLAQFRLFSPFEDMFNIILSTKFLHAMKRKRNDMLDSSFSIGTSLDELLRQHNCLRSLCVSAIASTLKKLLALGNDQPPPGTKIVMSLQKSFKIEAVERAGVVNGVEREEGPAEPPASPVEQPDEDDSEEEDVEEMDEASQDEPVPSTIALDSSPLLELTAPGADGLKLLPLGDYLCILGRLLEVLMTTSTGAPGEMLEQFLDADCVGLLLASTRIRALRTELASSPFPSSVSNILKHILQHTQRESTVLQLMKWAEEAVTPMAELANQKEGKVSLMAHLPVEQATALVTGITNTVMCLSALTRGATASHHLRDGDVRAKVVAMWAEDGAQLHCTLHRVYSVLGWEQAVITAISHSRKVSAQTQTEPEEGREKATDRMEDDGSDSVTTSVEPAVQVQVESVAVDVVNKPSSAASLGISEEEYNYYCVNRDLVKQHTKAYKQVAELLSYLSRVCVGSNQRSRRGYDPSPYAMSKPAQKLAEAMFSEYQKDLNFRPSTASHHVLCHFLSEQLSQLLSLIMDEKKQQYHHLLPKFYGSGCYDSALGLLSDFIVPLLKEHPVEGALERLLSEWCLFATRIANRQGLMQSRFKMIDSQARQFPLEKYYSVMQKDVFTSLQSLLPVLGGEGDERSLGRNSRALHVIFTLFAEVTNRLEYLRESSSGGGKAETPDASAVARLIDMGFDSSSATNALLNYGSVNEAMDALLAREVEPPIPQRVLEDMDPEVAQQLMNIIGNPVGEEEREDAGHSGEDAAQPMESSMASSSPSTSSSPAQSLQNRDTSVDWDWVVGETTTKWIPLMLKQMASSVDSTAVYHAADVAMAMAKHGPNEWRMKTLLAGYMRDEILNRIDTMKTKATEETARELAAFLHLSCLIFDTMAKEYLEVLSEGPSAVRAILDVLPLSLDKDDNSFISPVLLWLQLFEKSTRVVRRLAAYEGAPTLQWNILSHEGDRFGSLSRPKWTPLPEESGSVLTKALLGGRRTQTVRHNRREWVADLMDMQLRIENGGEKLQLFAVLPEEHCASIKIEEFVEQEQKAVFSVEEEESLVGVVVSLLADGRVGGHGAHSALSLIALLTRSHDTAFRFVKAGGVEALLQARGRSSSSTSLLLALVLRQCVEDAAVVAMLMEKSLRSLANNGTGQSAGLRYYAPPAPSKDWQMICAHFSPAATRSPAAYFAALSKYRMDKNGNMIGQSKEKKDTEKEEANSHIAPSAHMHTVVSALLREVVDGEWKSNDGRLFSRSSLLYVLAELTRSYPGIALHVAEEKNGEMSLVASLLDKYMDATIDKEMTSALTALLAAVASCNNSPRAQEAVVNDVRQCLLSLIASPTTVKIHLKVTEVATTLSAMMHACHNVTTKEERERLALPASSRPQPSHPITQNHIVKLINKKKMASELIACLTQLPLSKREAIDAVNVAVRTICDLAKNLNAAILPPATRGAPVDNSAIERRRLVEDMEDAASQDAAIEDAHVDPMEEVRVEMEAAPVPSAAHDSPDETAGEDIPIHEPIGRDADESMSDESMHSGEDEEVDVENDDEEDDEGDDEEEDEDEEEEEEEDEGELVGGVNVEAEAELAHAMASASAGGEEGDEPTAEEDDEISEVDEDHPEPMPFFDRMHEELPFDILRLLEREEQMLRAWPVGMGHVIEGAGVADGAISRIMFRDRGSVATFEVGGGVGWGRRVEASTAAAPSHPLLQRPANVWAEPAPNRALFTTTPTFHNLALRTHPRTGRSHLTRQNAVRRPGGPRGAEHFEDRWEHIFGIRGDDRLRIGAEVIATRAGYPDVILHDESDRERQQRIMHLLREHCPSLLERLREGGRVVDEQHSALLAVLLNSVALHRARAEEKLIAAEEKKKQAKTQAPLPPPEAPATEAAPEAPAAEMEQPAEEPQDEPMATTPPSASIDQPVQEEEPAPVAEGPSTVDEAEASPVDTPMEEVPPAAEETPAAAAAAEVPEEAPAVTGMQVVPEELREILGVSELPEGVDAAFLAALPDDMRAEVLRDHERQQRVARAAAPAPVATVEPLDQEFLNALPPELQEEIIAQHERAVRAAEASVAPPPPPEENPAEVIRSLPPTLRAQVLADADDTVLQALPQEMADEARRLRHERGHFIQARVPQHLRQGMEQLLGGVGAVGERVPRVLIGGRSVHRNYLRTPGSNANGGIGSNAGMGRVPPVKAPQVLDKEALASLMMMLFLDSRVHYQRIQSVLREVCQTKSHVNFLLYGLLSILEESCRGGKEIPSPIQSWTDSITVSGVGHNEKVLRIGEDGQVSIHPLLCPQVAKQALELLVQLSRTFPGSFLPQSLREGAREEGGSSPPPSASFWLMVAAFPSKMDKGRKEMGEWAVESLDQSPLFRMLNLLQADAIMTNSLLHDKLMKSMLNVVETLPNDSLTRLNAEEAEGEQLPLYNQLRLLCQFITSGSSSAEGLKDARLLLVEVMRAFRFKITQPIYDLLTQKIEQVGLELLPQLENLIQELTELPAAPSSSPVKKAPRDSDLQREAQRRNPTEEQRLLSALQSIRHDTSAPPLSSCSELQVASVRSLTEKGGAQGRLLTGLQTVSKMRDTLSALAADKAKQRKEEAEKKLAEEKKKYDEAIANKTQTGEFTAKVEDFMDVEVTCDMPTLNLSARLQSLRGVWSVLSECLHRLASASDPAAVLVLQPAAESFFLVHAAAAKKKEIAEEKEKDAMTESPPSPQTLNEDTSNMLQFAERHRRVLNQILRQNGTCLMDGPFRVLAHHPKLLDFDVKRTHFRKMMAKAEERNTRYRMRRDDFPLRVRRAHVFSDSFRELFRLRGQEWKARFYIMFEGEEGQDAGGLLREWFSVITREIFNPNYALFTVAPGDRVTYMINKMSNINPEHLDYFKFVGRIIAKAIHDNKLLDCYFTRALYKHILNLPVKYQDLESEDPDMFKSLDYMLSNPINELGLELNFTTEVDEFGVKSTRELKEGGTALVVTDDNKEEYVRLLCQMKMTSSIRQQLDSFLTGFYDVIPKQYISMFNEQELELLICGLPDVDIDDLMANTEYRSYNKNSKEIQWFWRALRSFEPEDRAKFLQFVTGTSKVPLNGFASLEGMNGVQKFSIHQDSRGGNRLPAAHTCFNQLDLPVYESYEALRDALQLAVRECTEGFGFA